MQGAASSCEGKEGPQRHQGMSRGWRGNSRRRPPGQKSEVQSMRLAGGQGPERKHPTSLGPETGLSDSKPQGGREEATRLQGSILHTCMNVYETKWNGERPQTKQEASSPGLRGGVKDAEMDPALVSPK